MPPKKKAPKINTEKRKAEYEKFIDTRDEEFDLWKDLSAQKTLYTEINTTTYDITENLEPFFEKLYQLTKAFKTKTKLKEYRYEHFRSFFFGGVGVRRDDSTDIEKAHDGLTRYVIKEDNDGAIKARHGFIEVYNTLEDVNDLTEENFYDLKKKMKDALTNFAKFFETHIKKHHKPIQGVMSDFLQVMRNVLQSNFYYSLFEYENQNPKDRALNEFKEQALLEKFCVDYQEAFRILFMTGFIKDNPNLFILTNKFRIPGWENNRIQSHFIKPLYETYITLRKEMNRLYTFGENHWVVPLGENIELVKLTNQMIELELVAERMLGSDLKRDQLNFLFNTVLYIYNTPVKEKLLADAPDNEVVVTHVIPKLVILRYLDHIVRITKAKRADVVKQDRMKEFIHMYRSGRPQSKGEQQTIITHEGTDIKDLELLENFRKRDTKVPFIVSMDEEDTPEDLDKFGRYWVWLDFLPENLEDEVLRGAEMLRNINVAVRQDLADEYISTALRIQPNAQKGRADVIKRKKEKTEMHNTADLHRPPHLWNHDDIVEKDHAYRQNTRPYDIYADSRVRDMNSLIESLAYELRNFTKDRWQELMERVINFFKENRMEEHTEIVDVKLPQTF